MRNTKPRNTGVPMQVETRPYRRAGRPALSQARRPTPLGFQTDPHGCPGGTAENSPAFQRWVGTPEGLSPEGTADSAPIQPSLWDFLPPNLVPSVETLGYSHPSLRDEQDQILVALDVSPAVTL